MNPQQKLEAACAGRFPLHGGQESCEFSKYCGHFWPFHVSLKSQGWLNDLKENGVVVIKDVFSKEEVQECWWCCVCLGVDTVSMKLLHHISSNPMFRF